MNRRDQIQIGRRQVRQRSSRRPGCRAEQAAGQTAPAMLMTAALIIASKARRAVGRGEAQLATAN